MAGKEEQEANEASYWNYRVVRCHDDDSANEILGTLGIPPQPILAIHEVYYSSNDKPISWSVDHMHPQGDCIEELKGDLMHMLEACEKPVLDMKELEKSIEDFK